ncbi:TetR/AcrR family transcriptional regulator [Frankia sp. AgKG'84/4]|uniref:TetR/AcrR family transcriptional regulator n=1 Tax=Frankia sp. AgKG'84/4 TaxID=573490 RepID=UPI00200F037D|nr:TetR/AcrR family transcriptional regulator [Frankia sp. AgKG'84/4]MCL9793319.1 TetR/AcrR family transcriptional regulator [Frankia sp. AgKG'84/4]
MTRSAAPLRQQLLDAALCLFSQRGFRGTSLQDIAREVGCSKASLLYHFASKEAILVELLAPSTAGMTELTDRLRDEPADRVAARAVEGLVDLVLRFRREIQLLLAEVADVSAARGSGGGTQEPEPILSCLAGRSTEPQARLRAWMALGAITLGAAGATDQPTELVRRELAAGARRVLNLT